MAIVIELNEASDLRRRVPCRIFTSNGTAPDTGAQGDAVIMAVNSFTTISLSSALTAVHAAQGMYMEQLSQSNVSVLGTHMLYHIAGDFPQHIATIQVVNANPFSTQSNILVDDIAAGTYSSVTIQGLSNYANISNVTLHAGTHSNVTIQGLSNYRNISNVTLHAGTHSDVTIQGVTRLNSSVTLNANTHSGATIQGVSNYANISNVTLHVGTHSGATVGVGGIAPAVYSGVSVEVAASGIVAGSLAAGAITSAKFAAGAIDAVALATDAGQEIADRLLTRNIEGASDTGRTVKQALAVLRNKVQIDGSTVTVFQTDDTTSSWTGTVTTGTNPISGVAPGA